jgi:YggT family protein
MAAYLSFDTRFRLCSIATQDERLLLRKGRPMNMLIDIIYILLNVVWWIIVIQAIMSWLIAFNVINTYNDFVSQIWQALDKMTKPIYAPIRRIMPDFGALDLSPMVVLLILFILMNVVLPNVARAVV